MTETTSARFGFTVWGNKLTDGPSMAEFNGQFAALEALAAKDTQGTLASRPTAGEASHYYYATDNETLYRDNGTSWKVVGANTVDETVRSSANNMVPSTINAASGQTADLFRAQVNSIDKYRVTATGNVIGGTFTGANVDLTSIATGTRGLQVTGIAAQTADLLALRNSAASDQFTVGAGGAIGGTFFSAQTDKAVVGGAGYTTLANQTTFTGSAALEVRSTKGGTGTYNDSVVVRHPGFDGTAVSRRLGLLLKLGDEISGDATKSGGMYLESSLANAATPKLVLARADTPAMTFFPSAQAQIHGQGLIAEGTVDINKTGAASLRLNTDAAIGAQGDSMYHRLLSGQSWYWYQDGVHSDTPGTAGAGGATAASLTSAGLWTTPRLVASSTADATLAQSAPAFMVGSASGLNLVQSTDDVQARNNGAGSTLRLNHFGGDVTVGAGGGEVSVGPGAFKIDGIRLLIYPGGPPPGSFNYGDVWIQV